MSVEIPEDRIMQRCLHCGAWLPAIKIEQCPDEPDKVMVTNYICSCVYQRMVMVKNVGGDNDSFFMIRS